MKNKKLLLKILSASVISTLPVTAISCNFEKLKNNTTDEKEKDKPNPNNNGNTNNKNENKNPSSDKNITPEHITGISESEFFNKYTLSTNYEINHAIKIDISRFYDGDTFGTKDGQKVRFSGIDTPETHKQENGKYFDTTGLQYEWGKKAESYTMKYLDTSIYKNKSDTKGRPVQVYIVPQKTKGGKSRNTKIDKNMCDHYGRIVAVVYYKNSEGLIFNYCQQIVTYGYAKMSFLSNNPSSKYYTPNKEYYNAMVKASEYAKQNKLGVYSLSFDDYQKVYPK